MIWCKVIVPYFLVEAALASLEQPQEYAIQRGVDQANSHANRLSHGEHDVQYTAQRYKFGYKIIDKYGNKQVREEAADEYNNRKGYYSFIDHDGKHRKVEYVADGHGFRAIVVTNEPGTAHSHPAGAKIIADTVNRVASEYSGGRFIDPRTTLPAASETSVLVPQSASVTPVAAIAHKASIAHVAHAGSAIAIQVPHEPHPLALSASLAPSYLAHSPQAVSQVVSSHSNIRLHPRSSGFNTVTSGAGARFHRQTP